jgi:predicted metal-dependent enzyme (double-stranded beta helix superfamily)
MLHARYLNELTQQYRQIPELGLEDAQAFLARLSRDPLFVASQIVPLLSYSVPRREPSIAATVGLREAATCLQVFVWPVGATTPIHDHTSWGAYLCVVGSLVEDRYERLDDGVQPSVGRLRRAWRRILAPSDGASTVLPYEQGIHRIANTSGRLAISVHLYGPRTGELDGRDYDPSRDFVCERFEIEQPAASLTPAFR